MRIDRSNLSRPGRPVFAASCLILAALICAPVYPVAPALAHTAAPKLMINIVQEFDKTPHQTYIDSSHALVAAAAARKQKLYARACALYFAAAYEPLSRGKLSEAKPVLDAAFALAPQVSPANRSEICSVVNRFANDLRDSKMSADCRLYLSQKFLNMCRRDKATSEESLSYATESVAFDCFESAQYGRSALLFEGLIARLEASHPIDHRIREWLLLLCRIYEADKKPLLAEQTYKCLIKFGRATYPEEIADDLEIYDFFLIRQHKFKEAIPVSKELLTAAVKPHQLSRLGRRDWLGLAASLESVNGNLAAEFYKVAFDLGAGKYPSAGAFSKRRLADVAFQWSAMLRDKGRNAESLAVLDRAIELTQATSSAQSAREMQRLLDCREQRLLAMGRVAEARKQAALREKFEQDIQTWERVQEAHNNRAIIEAAASPQAPSIAKIKGLTAEAYAAAEAGNCRGGLSKLSAALDLYDRSAPAEISSASECFTDIGLRFKSCLTDKEAVEILVRILRRYLTVGLPEAEFTSREYIAHFPFSRVHIAQSALNELSTRAAGDPALYTRLLNMATESGKPANVLYVLALHRSGTVVESIEDLEEREKWRMRAHDSTGLTATRLMAAQRYLEANKFSKAREKLALCVQDSASLPKIRKYPDCAGDPFVRFGDEFAAKHSLDDAQWAYLQALSPVLKDKHFDPDELLSKLVGLADQYEKAGRGRDAKAFLQQVLLTLRKVGAQNTPVARQLNLRLAHCNNGSLRSSKILKE